MPSDILIAQAAKMQKIKEIAKKIDIHEDELELYGDYKAKISHKAWERVKDNDDAKLVLVTAINPTPAGEGKSTTMVGLGQAMWKIGKKAIVAIREPSMGPVFGIKGGAAGGGHAQVIPMEDINLHFTGDMHAISQANNLLSAMIDNHMQQGNELGIDPRQISWKRCLDLNDRSLRNVVVGLGGKLHGLAREDGFNITVASEIMAILCLANDLDDLKERLANIIIGYSFSGLAIRAKDLKVHGSMAVILKDAIKPNLVQTLENTPAIMHGGPFANTAHGCNSVRATKLALKLSDIVLTEAGFGADLGAEKFLNIKCRLADLKPDAVVLVATTRALAYNGEGEENEKRIEKIKRGIVNLERHIENLQQFDVPVVVTLNAFSDDTSEEIEFVRSFCDKLGADFACSWVWERGGEGGKELAEKVVDVLENKKANFEYLYNNEMPIDKKIITIAQKIYRARDVRFSAKALKNLKQINELGMEQIPVCMAKTQYSFSDDPKKLGAPNDFDINIKEVRLSAGAGFAVALAGDIMTMPGLPKKAAAEEIDIEDGVVKRLF